MESMYLPDISGIINLYFSSVAQKFVPKEQTNITPVKLVYKPAYSQDEGNIFFLNVGKILPEDRKSVV
jgi:hypothetical protein